MMDSGTQAKTAHSLVEVSRWENLGDQATACGMERSKSAADTALPLIKADLAVAGVQAMVSIHAQWSADDGAAGVVVEFGNDVPSYALWLRPGYSDVLDEDAPEHDTWVIDVAPPLGRDSVRQLHTTSELEAARDLLVAAIRHLEMAEQSRARWGAVHQDLAAMLETSNQRRAARRARRDMEPEEL